MSHLNIRIFLLLTVLQTSIANAEWSGYVNSKTDSDRPYGYLRSVSTSEERSKIKLVCFQPDIFEIYLDEKITSPGSKTHIKLQVDQLGALVLPAERTGGATRITHQISEFWNLIAQISAGAELTIDTGSGPQYRYSLLGFTKAYEQTCGWIDSANRYHIYLHRYR